MKRLSLLSIFLISTCSGMEPVILTPNVVQRTTRQIMQGVPPLKQRYFSPNTAPLTPGIPQIVQHVTAADYQESGQYGPSGESSVGTSQVLLASKGRIRSFLKNGKIDNVLNLTHDSFFSPISSGGFTADPNVIFHPQLKRWIIFGGAFLQSSLVLAISDSDLITPDTVWRYIVVDKVNTQDFSPSAFFDYSTLGADEYAIYCGANILDYNNPSFFTSSAVYAIPFDTITCSEATVYGWRSLRDLGPNSVSLFTPWPVLNFDAQPSAGYVVSQNLNEALTGFGSSFVINTITFDGPVPLLSAPIEIPVLPFAVPFSVLTLGTPLSHPVSPVASFRLTPTHIRNNRLWLMINIGVDNHGISELPLAVPPQGTITRDAARFTQIDITKLSNPTTAVISQGTLFERTATNELGARSYLTPAIMSNEQGAVLIAATATAANERLNAVVAPLINDNTAVGEPVFYTNSNSNYYATEDWEFNPFARWGDHTRVSPDPVDPTSFWTVQQWCSQENTWGLELAQIRLKK